MATTIISSKQIPPGLSEFMVQVLDQMQEIKPKHIAIICVDESRDYYGRLCQKKIRCPDWYGWFCGEWNKIQVTAERLRKDANEVDL